jgi:hypothetical protein
MLRYFSLSSNNFEYFPREAQKEFMLLCSPLFNGAVSTKAVWFGIFDKLLIVKDLDGSSRGLIYVLSWYFPIRIRKTTQIIRINSVLAENRTSTSRI